MIFAMNPRCGKYGGKALVLAGNDKQLAQQDGVSWGCPSEAVDLPHTPGLGEQQSCCAFFD